MNSLLTILVITSAYTTYGKATPFEIEPEAIVSITQELFELD